eukprot:5461141-Pyramimonas_sp.AAC.1
MHVQVFVQCLHQHAPLHELLQLPTDLLKGPVEEHKRYKRNVSRQEHADVEGWRGRKTEVEKEWPTCRETAGLAAAP